MIDFHEESIILQTRKGTNVENAQYHVISAFEKNQINQLENRYGDIVSFRGTVTSVYNCHGMVFASRRTGIYNPQEVLKIIREDGYVEIPLRDVLPGDVLLYFEESGDIEHSAIVITAPTKEQLGIPRVFSKWGKFKEAIHYANQCPYDFRNTKYYRIKE